MNESEYREIEKLISLLDEKVQFQIEKLSQYDTEELDKLKSEISFYKNQAKEYRGKYTQLKKELSKRKRKLNQAKEEIEPDLLVISGLYRKNEVFRKSVHDFVRNYFELLTDRSSDVLWRRLVFKETLDEIANDYDISRERVRQIENRAIRIAKKAFPDNAKDGEKISIDINEIPEIPITTADFSVRAVNLLIRAKLLTIRDIAKALSENKNYLDRLRNCGNKTKEEIMNVLKSYEVEIL